jgi:hypothetical protein
MAKKYEVHFTIEGHVTIEADDPEAAVAIVNTNDHAVIVEHAITELNVDDDPEEVD